VCSAHARALLDAQVEAIMDKYKYIHTNIVYLASWTRWGISTETVQFENNFSVRLKLFSPFQTSQSIEDFQKNHDKHFWSTHVGAAT
jgi:hypothetical protein